MIRSSSGWWGGGAAPLGTSDSTLRTSSGSCRLARSRTHPFLPSPSSMDTLHPSWFSSSRTHPFAPPAPDCIQLWNCSSTAWPSSLKLLCCSRNPNITGHVVAAAQLEAERLVTQRHVFRLAPPEKRETSGGETCFCYSAAQGRKRNSQIWHGSPQTHTCLCSYTQAFICP